MWSETSVLCQDRSQASENGLGIVCCDLGLDLADLVLHGLEAPVIITSSQSSGTRIIIDLQCFVVAETGKFLLS